MSAIIIIKDNLAEDQTDTSIYGVDACARAKRICEALNNAWPGRFEVITVISAGGFEIPGRPIVELVNESIDRLMRCVK